MPHPNEAEAPVEQVAPVEQQAPVQQAPVEPAPMQQAQPQQPQGPDPVAAQLAAMQRQNEMLMQQLERLGRPQQAAEPDLTPPEELAPEVRAYLDKTVSRVQQQAQAALGSLQDQLDATQFQSVAAQSGLEPAQVQQAEMLYRQWRKTGMAVEQVDPDTGRVVRVPPSRLDALSIALGRTMLEQGIKAAPVRQKTQLQALLGGGRPAGGGFEPQQPRSVLPSNFNQLPTEKRIATFEAALGDAEF